MARSEKSLLDAHSISKWPDSRAPLLSEWRTTSLSAVLTASASFSQMPTAARIWSAIRLVAVPDERHSLAVAWRRAHGRYALYFNARRNRSGHLWQNRFYSCPLDQRHLWIARRYVERNPVRANRVARPEQYDWSSAAAHLGTACAPEFLDWEFYDEVGGAEPWAGLLAEPEELIDIRALQR